MKGENKEKKCTLHVMPGIDQPEQVNPNRLRRRRKQLTTDEYVDGILGNNRTILGQAITLIESNKPEHTEIAQKIVEKCLPHSGNSIRIGITGVPGVGKSSFIESFGMMLTGKDKKIAVLAVDPSSEKTKGSILGDKTRMEKLSGDEKAFIRPSPSAGSLGGVARKTRESIILCEAAGFDTILIETVGVGQSEVAVHSMVDFFLLLMLAGAGDELQGIKRGIMEMADCIAITKADGNNINAARLAKSEYENALHLFPPTSSGWQPKVITCSSLTNKGIDEIEKLIQDYISYTNANDFFKKNRGGQARYWMYESINESLKNSFYQNEKIRNELDSIEEKVVNGEMNSFFAAKSLLKLFDEINSGNS